MKIKFSEILIESITKEVFVNYWKTSEYESINYDPFSKIDLKVPTMVRGEKANTIVSSEIILKENNKGVELHFYSDFRKCIFYSLLIGILPSLFFLLLYSSIVLFIGFALLVSVGVFIMFYRNTQKVSKKYLEQVKQKFV